MREFTVRNDKGESFQVDEDKIQSAEKDGYYPVVSNGGQEHLVPFKDLHLAEKDGFSPLKSARDLELEKGQKLENSILRGAKQGITRGTSDEAAGHIDTALDYGMRALNAVGLADKSPGQVNEELKQAGFKGQLPSSRKEIYEEGRDSERAADKQAAEDNPLAYGAANLTGSLVGSMASPAAMIGDAAIQGLGYSEADTMKDLAVDVGTSAAMSAGIQGAGKLSGKLAEYLGNKFSSSAPAAVTAKLAKDNAGLVGATAGGLSHGPIGAVTGYMAGKEAIPKVIEKAEPLINKFDEGFQYTMKNLPAKYKAIMDSAVARGGAQSQAIQHFLLGQRDPEYQELTKDSSKE